MEQSSSGNVQAMSTLRSNLNSVSKALKKRINTCFEHWRHQNVHQQQQPHQQHHHQHHHQREYYQRLLYHEFHLANFASKTSENLKIFNSKLRKLFRKNSKESPHQRGDPIIVAKLLSSTLIATTTTTQTLTTTTTTTSARSVEDLRAVEELRNMTVTDESIMQIREEYPDLDAEVRSILISRAQSGATIANIRDDYRKNVGLYFPIYDNVTEYLLSIPSVSAMCNDQGTRIFSIRPTEKTKHLYDMVQQQKPPQEYTRPTYPRGGRRRVHPYSEGSNRSIAQSWRSSVNNPRHGYSGNRSHEQHQRDYLPNNYEFSAAAAAALATATANEQPPRQQYLTAAALEAVADNGILRSELEGAVDNCYYQDNCNYFYGRLYNQPPNLPTYLMNSNELLNLNENFGLHNTHHHNYNSLPQPVIQPITQPLVEPLQSQKPSLNLSLPIVNTHSGAQRSTHNYRDVLPGPPSRAAICSSPSGTRSSRTSDSMYTSDPDYEAHLLDFPLLGDDFFLYLARMELKCKFKKYQKVLQSGLCVSGQTINAAVKRVRKLGDTNRHIIVNIGSVDILQGRPLVQIEHDFRLLISMMRKKGITPILTTLAPLANYSHETQIKQKLERFNTFIKREGISLRVIDIYSCLVNERKQTLFDCYQNEPRSVTGAAEPYVFWNKIGRQRVLQMIESKIEY